MSWCEQLEAAIQQEQTKPPLPATAWIVLGLVILLLFTGGKSK